MDGDFGNGKDEKSTLSLKALSHLLPSRNNLLDHPPIINLQPLPPRYLELVRIQPQLVQHRRVNVRDIMTVLDGVEADLVRLAVGDSALDAAAGQPVPECLTLIIPPVTLPACRPPESSAPHPE